MMQTRLNRETIGSYACILGNRMDTTGRDGQREFLGINQPQKPRWTVKPYTPPHSHQVLLVKKTTVSALNPIEI